MELLPDELAGRRIAAAVIGVRVLVAEQALEAAMFGAYLLHRNDGRDLPITIIMLLIVLGLPAMVYGMLCSSLKDGRFWAVPTLIGIVAVHLLCCLFLLATCLDSPSIGPSIVLALMLVPKAVALVFLSRAICAFGSRGEQSQSHGFQVVLPIDSERGK